MGVVWDITDEYEVTEFIPLTYILNSTPCDLMVQKLQEELERLKSSFEQWS